MKRNSLLSAFSLTCLGKEVPTLSRPRGGVVTQSFPSCYFFWSRNTQNPHTVAIPHTTMGFAFLCENSKVRKIPPAVLWSSCMSLGPQLSSFLWLVKCSLAAVGRTGSELALLYWHKHTPTIYSAQNTLREENVSAKQFQTCWSMEYCIFKYTETVNLTCKESIFHFLLFVCLQ